MQLCVAFLLSPLASIFIIEIFPIIKLERHNKVKKIPKFSQTVLKRCSRDEQLVICIEIFQSLIQQTFLVLQPVSFVNHQTGPVQGTQLRLVLQHYLIGCQQGIELGPPVPWMDPLLGPDEYYYYYFFIIIS